MYTYNEPYLELKPLFGNKARRMLAPVWAGLIAAWFLTVPHLGHAKTFQIPAGDVTELINAINTANANGDCDTIHLTASTYTLTDVDNDTDGPNGLPSITTCLTIKGTGADKTDIEREVGPLAFRIFHVGGTGNLALEGMTVAKGRVASGAGGAIFNSGTLLITKSVVRDSSVSDSGGGIFSNKSLTLIDSRVDNNTAFWAGGIDSRNELTVRNSSLDGNRGEDSCGGMQNSGHATIIKSTVAHSVAGVPGGGICNMGTMDLENSTVSNNVAEEASGIENFGTMTITHSTIADNHGIYTTGGLVNHGEVTVTHSIIAGNIGSGGEPGTPQPSDCSGGFTSLGHNLVGAGGGCPSNGPGDRTLDPTDVFVRVLTPLQNNGGGTETHALLPRSPAIDTGQNGSCLIDTDQRGEARPQGDACDAGAVEFLGGPSRGYQAEATLMGGGCQVETNHRGFNRTGFVNCPKDNGSVEWRDVDGGSGGDVLIAFRYALGVSSPRTAELRVNGAKRDITFEPTGSWSSWKHVFVRVTLQGNDNNTIRIETIGDDAGNIDELVLGLQAEDADIQGGRIEDNHDGFRGTGFIDLNPADSDVKWSTVDGRDGGEFALTFRYALGRDESRTANLIVNGNLVRPITFESTGSWTTWKTIKETVTLNPSVTNTIRIETTGEDAGNIDQVFVTN